LEISRGPFSALVGASSAASRTTTLLGIIGALLGALLILWIYRKTRKPAAAA
jgi:uncharacterized membrane protein YeaQ/YmgE (transglycosylase-associated protein family)